MEKLKFNSVLRILSADLTGIFRVIVAGERNLLFKISDIEPQADGKVLFPVVRNESIARRRRKSDQTWFTVAHLDISRYQALGEVTVVEVQRPASNPTSEKDLPARARKNFLKAKAAARLLCDPDVIARAHSSRRGFTKLVEQVFDIAGISRSTVYEYFFRLATHGFTLQSLIPQLQNCGAPGHHRPWGKESGRKKPGRKFNKERDAILTQKALKKASRHTPMLPDGWAQVQTNAIINAYRRLRTPTKSFAKLL